MNTHRTSNVVKVRSELKVLVNISPAHASGLHHPALDLPSVICPAIHAVLAHLAKEDGRMNKVTSGQSDNEYLSHNIVQQYLH